ncbi:MAG: phenylalanine--tRNA ligase subunit alpha [Melioribacteraceae bacterium]|nr:phenylalanine--tRNA ligase subunit alpha [Melioribacteraceae bacterium]MCO6472460.1 phenylalanine--tRNA ligase subunit alpha [Melioribacteraceae bacterium]MDD3559074.1 phenylalanine--tRNA ligase subunit alpha [Melioribacteraceae bacterium]
MEDKIKSLLKNFPSELDQITDKNSLENFRIKYFGRKGIIAELFEDFKKLSGDEKPKYGKRLNEIKNDLQTKFDGKKLSVESEIETTVETIDFSLPGRKYGQGTKHILSQTMNEIMDVFIKIGFSVYEGPELESDYYNFEALNFPEDHPARDMQDTFFLSKDFVLRTHTSPVQIRLMENKKPPIRAIMPGKVYRNEAISFKSYCLFHQVEGLVVDKNITFAELKGTLVYFLKEFLGKDVKYRFRASFFPFTEPSAEVDIWWQPEGKEGRWLEILGCGMVDPNVLKNVGIDPEVYTGYAFGIGVERNALRKYDIDDIRTFFDNDKRFLVQF